VTKLDSEGLTTFRIDQKGPLLYGYHALDPPKKKRNTESLQESLISQSEEDPKNQKTEDLQSSAKYSFDLNHPNTWWWDKLVLQKFAESGVSQRRVAARV
jgi:hypothetical protein